jgi:hypothetical protein
MGKSSVSPAVVASLAAVTDDKLIGLSPGPLMGSINCLRKRAGRSRCVPVGFPETESWFIFVVTLSVR